MCKVNHAYLHIVCALAAGMPLNVAPIRPVRNLSLGLLRDPPAAAGRRCQVVWRGSNEGTAVLRFRRILLLSLSQEVGSAVENKFNSNLMYERPNNNDMDLFFEWLGRGAQLLPSYTTSKDEQKKRNLFCDLNQRINSSSFSTRMFITSVLNRYPS